MVVLSITVTVMEKLKLEIDRTKVFEKAYKIRSTKTAFVTTIPKIVLEREAKRLRDPLEKVCEVLEIKWLFDDFDGLVAILVPKNHAVKTDNSDEFDGASEVEGSLGGGAPNDKVSRPAPTK